MQFDSEHGFPQCAAIRRTVLIGSLRKAALLEALQRNAIAMNTSGEQLFASDRFTTSPTRYAVTTVELTIGDLGFPQGATSAEIAARAQALGLGFCPLELGPHLRLQYRDQPEGYWGMPVRHHQAPYGALTIASEPLTEDDDLPKGFYLRRIAGVLWLRGYHSGPEYVWQPDDHFIFWQP